MWRGEAKYASFAISGLYIFYNFFLQKYNAISLKNHNFIVLGVGGKIKILNVGGIMEPLPSPLLPKVEKWSFPYTLINYIFFFCSLPFSLFDRKEESVDTYAVWDLYFLCSVLQTSQKMGGGDCFPSFFDQTFGHFQTRNIRWDLFIERSIAQHPLLQLFPWLAVYHRSAEIVEPQSSQKRGLVRIDVYISVIYWDSG